MEIKKSIEIYEGLKGNCYRVENNPSSPFVYNDYLYEGGCFTMPQVGCRFRCGSLDTNIVAKILETTKRTVKFETLSGSVYLFTIIEEGKVSKEVELPDNTLVVEAVKEYLEE
jgi:hypothetical protein